MEERLQGLALGRQEEGLGRREPSLLASSHAEKLIDQQKWDDKKKVRASFEILDRNGR